MEKKHHKPPQSFLNMSSNNMVYVFRNSDEADEVLVPKSLLVVLWIARTIGAVPARLRRERTGWQLSVSSPLVKLQRIIAVITIILLFSSALIRAITMEPICSHEEEKCFLIIISKAELTLIAMLFVLATCTGSNKLRAVIHVIRTTQKINSSLGYDTDKSKCKMSIDVILIVYVIWQILTNFEDLINKIYRLPNETGDDVIALVVRCFTLVIYYQALTGTMIRIMISAIILELKFTLTLLNDKLEDLLVTPPTQLPDIKFKLYMRELIPQNVKTSASFTKCIDAPSLEEDVRGIRHMNRCYDMICDMIAHIDNLSGPYLLLVLMLISVQLLTTPQTLIARLGALTVYEIISTTNQILTVFMDLLVLVEPCQRLQDQMDRTRCLLGRLVRQAQHCGCDPAQLDLFIFVTQMRDVALSPMGVITIGRSLVGSMIGVVVTYLIIVIQFENASEAL